MGGIDKGKYLLEVSKGLHNGVGPYNIIRQIEGEIVKHVKDSK